MVQALVLLMQLAAVAFLAWGAYLCLFCRDRRAAPRLPAKAQVIDLSSASRDRATDFEIGFRRSHEEKLAA